MSSEPDDDATAQHEAVRVDDQDATGEYDTVPADGDRRAEQDAVRLDEDDEPTAEHDAVAVDPDDDPAARQPAVADDWVPPSSPAVSLVKAPPAEPVPLQAVGLSTPLQRGGPDPRRSALAFVSMVSTIVALLTMGFLLEFTLFGALAHARNQAQAFAEFRIQLADGTAPVGPLDLDGTALAAGTPVAILEIPRLELQEVVFEGPTSRVLMAGPGHQRDTVLPGQVGTSVVLGRRGGYGGPFRSLDTLRPGDAIVATTGQGRHTFAVLGVRRAGDPLPPPLVQGRARLTLVTTDGPVYQPTGVLLIDADIISDAQTRGVQIPRGAAPANEAALAGDPNALLALMLWGPLLVTSAIGVVWVQHLVGPWQAWVIGVPVLGLFGVLVVDSAAALLPNIL